MVGGGYIVLDLDLGSDHNSGPYFAILCKAFNFSLNFLISK